MRGYLTPELHRWRHPDLWSKKHRTLNATFRMMQICKQWNAHHCHWMNIFSFFIESNFLTFKRLAMRFVLFIVRRWAFIVKGSVLQWRAIEWHWRGWKQTAAGSLITAALFLPFTVKKGKAVGGVFIPLGCREEELLPPPLRPHLRPRPPHVWPSESVHVPPMNPMKFVLNVTYVQLSISHLEL